MGNLFSTNMGYQKFDPMDYYQSDVTGKPMEDGTVLTHTAYIRQLEDEIKRLKDELTVMRRITVH